MIQVNTVIKTLFPKSSKKQLHETINTFWSEFKKYNHKNDPFDSNEFILSSTDNCGVKSHLWHQKCSLPSTTFLRFVTCRATSKIIEIEAAERLWDGVKTVNSGNMLSLGSDISEKQSIVNTSDFNE